MRQPLSNRNRHPTRQTAKQRQARERRDSLIVAYALALAMSVIAMSLALTPLPA